MTGRADPPFTRDEHWRFFAEFVAWESACGGPDPHLATLGHMIKDCSWEERVWRCGLYAAGYNVPTAEAIWQEWPWPRVLEEAGEFEQWVHVVWPGLALRRERRAVRTPTKFTRCVRSYAEWMTTLELADWWGQDDFPRAWDHINRNVWGMGRYVLLKLVEALVRYCDAGFKQSDIRAKGAASPREGLALLWPQDEVWLLDHKRQAMWDTEQLALDTKAVLETDWDLAIDFFTLQVVLCEYKKCWEGKQYPGRTHDTELRYWKQVQDGLGQPSTMLEAREAVFPKWALGEHNGWWRQREDLEACLPVHRYTWSDALYDYNATDDPADPAVRDQIPKGLLL